MMFDFLIVPLRRLFVLACIATLTACGGGGSSDSSGQQNVSSAGGDTYQITGAGIKGPLAYANVGIYALDTNFSELYDPDKPVATATTNAYAEITGLSVSRNASSESAPPYVLVVDGTNAIDRNTNTAPVIKKLVTIITRESLAVGQPVYATPYTTLAYQMLRLDTRQTGNAGAARGTVPQLASRLSSFSQEIIQTLGFHIPAEIDIFTTPPIITKATNTIDKQLLVVYYRSAIEAISSIFHEMSLATGSTLPTDTLIQYLALDYYSDGVVDGAANGASIKGIDTDILRQNPMLLEIPNTQYTVSDIYGLMYEERALVGASANVPFYFDETGFELDSVILDATGDTNSAPPGNSNNTNLLLHADFDNRPIGPYAENDIRTDFQVNMHGRNHPNWYVEDMDIVADPDSSGRGNVLRVKRYANRGWAGPGNGGMEFRADFAAQEDVFFAYDMYLAPDHEFMLNQKNPGLASGAHSNQHPDNNTFPTPETLENFVHVITAEGQNSWGRGDGALATYFYDKDAISGVEFWDIDNPDFNIPNWNNTGEGGNQYHQPRGRWITVEVRVKMNTVTVEGVSGLKDGLQEVWVTDPQLWAGSKKVSSHYHRWRITNSIVTDGIEMALGYGGDGDDPGNQPSKDQYHYYDNFRVSTNPITH